MGALDNLLVLDFSTLLPGPIATLFMADAGATVVKIERPGRGDEMRSYAPFIGDQSVNFTMLNRGKQSIALDLKAPGAVEKLRPLIEKADIVVEQFRPDVMARLGLGYEDLRKINPRLIYCSITGWGQHGPKSPLAGHDLNYMAETGVLGLSIGADGAPILPPVLAADIGGGAYPALVNILLALVARERTGQGCHLDVAMADNLFPFLYWALGNANAMGQWPVPGGEVVTGGTPRYQIYRTSDGRHLACAPLEEKFWENFTRIIGLDPALRDPSADPVQTREAIAALIATRSAEDWRKAFEGVDVCCSVVATLQEGVSDPHVAARRVFDRVIETANGPIPALPSIVAPALRSDQVSPVSPDLGAARDPQFQV